MFRFVTSSINLPVVPVAYNSFLLRIPLYAIQKFCMSFFFESCATKPIFIVTSKIYCLTFCRLTFRTKPIPPNKDISELKPELINRIDSIIVFNRLREEQLRNIVSLQLNKLKQRLLEKNIDVEFDQSVIDAVMKSGLNTEYGARQIKRAIQTIVENPIAAYIVSDEITEGDKITFMIENGGAKYKKK